MQIRACLAQAFLYLTNSPQLPELQPVKRKPNQFAPQKCVVTPILIQVIELLILINDN